jgi:hypothetical protein
MTVTRISRCLCAEAIHAVVARSEAIISTAPPLCHARVVGAMVFLETCAVAPAPT